MPSRKRNKRSKWRGYRSFGHGKHKKRAGGMTGGRGRGGSGKRADSKKPSYWTEGRPRKLGFIPKNSIEVRAINIENITLMIEHGKFEKKHDSYEINLDDLGYTKLLSKGHPKYKINITVQTATEKAIKKISEIGGTVVTENKAIEKTED